MTRREDSIKDYPTMFHYLLEMHKNGESMARLEFNIPISAFPTAKMQTLLSLEAMLLDYGKQQRSATNESPPIQEAQ